MTTILRELCSLPTAPFLEGRVVEYIRDFVSSRKKLRLARDEHGNLMISLAGKSKAVARWVFTAHMDHPGLISGNMIDAQTVECELRGWVLAELMKEEEGFIGAVAASIEPRLLKKSDRLVAIECSAAQPYAPIGGGAIIRVGDRTSIFNSALTYFLTQQAETLVKEDSSFKYQRQLMPGGTCEATVYDGYGFNAASRCVALGNYQNR